MAVVVQDDSRHNNTACDKAFSRFLRPNLGQAGTQDRNDKHAEERGYHRSQAAFSSIKPISARANCQTILAVIIKPKLIA